MMSILKVIRGVPGSLALWFQDLFEDLQKKIPRHFLTKASLSNYEE